MNWCGSKKLKNVSESVILAYLEYKAKKLRNCDLFFNQKLLNVIVICISRMRNNTLKNREKNCRQGRFACSGAFET
jgi:hypothetical protein